MSNPLWTGLRLNPRDVAAAQARLDVTKATRDQAQSNLGLIDAQIPKLTGKAPEDVVVLRRSVEPGEMMSPGGVALVLGQLTTGLSAAWGGSLRFARG